MARSLIVATLFLLAAIAPAQAQITLRFSPADTTIAPDGSGRLSLMLDEALTVRTIDVRIAFDPAVVTSLGGSGGQLFSSSGFQLFQQFQDSAPGEWYGFTVVIGAGDFITGPGELYYWDFEAAGLGVSAITDVQTYMSDGNGDWYPETVVTPNSITVANPTSAVGDLPSLRGDLRLWPNPFNPRTSIGFELDQPGWVELAVFDIRGRKVAVLQNGLAPAGKFERSWDGLDTNGLAQPGGVYLFRLETPAGRLATRGVLLK